jgi:hypothetical protein
MRLPEGDAGEQVDQTFPTLQKDRGIARGRGKRHLARLEINKDLRKVVLTLLLVGHAAVSDPGPLLLVQGLVSVGLPGRKLRALGLGELIRAGAPTPIDQNRAAAFAAKLVHLLQAEMHPAPDLLNMALPTDGTPC